MSLPTRNEFDRSASVADAERTLRAIAKLPAPEGIADRVKTRLHTAPRKAGAIARPSTVGSGRWAQFAPLRAAAAAAIVMAVGGGAWELYTHIQIAPQPAAFVAPLHTDGSRGLSSAGAVRKPQTLDGPVLAPTHGKLTSDELKSGDLNKKHQVGAANGKNDDRRPARQKVSPSSK